ncbi:MAG: hypothetical protein FWC79_01185 [Oscillospiraceae bacterium]|nr:hypothetical protein [Oscillospiraceae bacterium]
MENLDATIPNLITHTINVLFSNLFSSIDNSLYSILDDLVFVSTDIIDHPHLGDIIGNNISGIILVANSLVIAFLIYYSITYLLSHFTFSQVQNPYQFIFRLLLCVIFINFSYSICYALIFSTSTLSLAIRSIGENLFDTEIGFSSIIQNVNTVIFLEHNAFNIFSIDGLLKGFISIGLLNLLLSYALRYVIILVFILISPFAFLSLILTDSSWIFKSWLKIFLFLLMLQVFVSLILLVCFSISATSSDMFSRLIYIGSIYALMKANNYLRDFMIGLGTDISMGVNSIKSMFAGGHI